MSRHVLAIPDGARSALTDAARPAGLHATPGRWPRGLRAAQMP
ncbi:hypothetical protein ACRAWG_26910 [Methylobacterium sp. P31]